MVRELTETLRPSAAELRDEAWGLLEKRRQVSDQQVRRELALRAFELAQAAEQLEYEAAKLRDTIPISEMPTEQKG